MRVFSSRLYVSKTWGHIVTVKLNWLMDCPGGFVHFFSLSLIGAQRFDFADRLWWNPRFGLEPRNMESLGLFLVWEVPFGGKFGDDVGWPKKASQVASVGGSKRHFPWSLIKSSGFFLRDVWFLYLRCRLRDASSRPDFRCLKIFGNLKWKAEWMKTKGVIKHKFG